MAGSKGSKYFDVFLGYKFWLNTKDGEGVLGEGMIYLLNKIKSEGSIQAAANECKISYRKAWGNIKKAEKTLNFSIVEKKRGGKDGGRTNLTDDGEKLLEAFDELKKEFDKAIHNTAKKFFKNLNNESTAKTKIINE
ncbi:MAG: LysR family transcriptional regulator [Bacteroidales bacterium]|jgi:molybdate transport system regulatory protein|nr:LysR family transcriptional regulator [Bacteroidales bacterium]